MYERTPQLNKRLDLLLPQFKVCSFNKFSSNSYRRYLVLSGSLGTFDKTVNSNNMIVARMDFGEYLNLIRTEKGLSQKVVADKLGIDISLLSKIEHGERQVQGHMLNGVAELFGLDYKDIQIKFLSQKMEKEFGEEPYFYEALESIQYSKKGDNY